MSIQNYSLSMNTEKGLNWFAQQIIYWTRSWCFLLKWAFCSSNINDLFNQIWKKILCFAETIEIVARYLRKKLFYYKDTPDPPPIFANSGWIFQVNPLIISALLFSRMISRSSWYKILSSNQIKLLCRSVLILDCRWCAGWHDFFNAK